MIHHKAWPMFVYTINPKSLIQHHILAQLLDKITRAHYPFTHPVKPTTIRSKQINKNTPYTYPPPKTYPNPEHHYSCYSKRWTLITPFQKLTIIKGILVKLKDF